jgi:hypothetical protein
MKPHWTKGPGWESLINIRPEYRIPLTYEIARRWKMSVTVELSCVYANRGWCYGGRNIKLPRPAVGCELETIIHELTHAYEWQIKRRNSHHGKDFKNSLSLLRHHTRPQYVEIFRTVKERVADYHASLTEAVRKQTERAERQAQRKAERKLVRKSRAFRMLNLQQRIKRLESRKKRLETLLKSAHRSLSTLERFEKVSAEKQGVAS